MHHDIVGDRIENLGPLAARLCNAGEQPGIFKRHRSVPDQRLQQVQIVGQQFAADVPKTQDAQQVRLRAFEANQREVLPSEGLDDIFGDQLQSAAGDFQVGIFFRVLRQRGVQPPLQVAFGPDSVKADAFNFAALGQRQNRALGLHHGANTDGEAVDEFRQAQRRAQFQRHFHQGFGALAVLV